MTAPETKQSPDDTDAAALERIELEIQLAVIKNHPATIRITQALEAQENAQSCGQCGKPIKADAPIWRRRIQLGRDVWDQWRQMVVPCCRDCGARSSRYHRSCEGCGRDVYQAMRVIPSRTFCCMKCEDSARAAEARHRRAEARGTTRTCQACGETFEPTRSDSKYCGAACKQKAYRRRVTDGESITGLAIDSRNSASGSAIVTDSESNTCSTIDSRNAEAPP
jgi:hypothetical protein